MIDRADVMSVESNMIILRTHVIFQKLSQNFKVFFQSLSSIRIPLNNIKP